MSAKTKRIQAQLFITARKKAPESEIWVYSDGSRDAKGNAGAGWAIYKGSRLISKGNAGCGRRCDISDAEALAARCGLEHAMLYLTSRRSLSLGTIPAVSLCIDNKGVVNKLLSPSKASSAPSEILNGTRELIATWTASPVHVFWIPSHQGIPGNEKADDLAKAACQLALSKIWKDKVMLDGTLQKRKVQTALRVMAVRRKDQSRLAEQRKQDK